MIYSCSRNSVELNNLTRYGVDFSLVDKTQLFCSSHWVTGVHFKSKRNFVKYLRTPWEVFEMILDGIFHVVYYCNEITFAQYASIQSMFGKNRKTKILKTIFRSFQWLVALLHYQSLSTHFTLIWYCTSKISKI